jgi:hypothetical protein
MAVSFFEAAMQTIQFHVITNIIEESSVKQLSFYTSQPSILRIYDRRNRHSPDSHWFYRFHRRILPLPLQFNRRHAHAKGR